jgi:putative DNA primase/helicase
MSSNSTANVVDFDEKRRVEEAAEEAVLSEDHVALAFVRRHSGTVRFDCTVKRWFIWQGNRWKRDDTDIAFDWTRKLVRALAGDQSAADRRRLGSRKFADGVERFARTDQEVAVTHEYWDNDVDVLGTPSGIIDLRTGQLFDPNPDQGITRSVAVDPDTTTRCPRWNQFLNQVTGNDDALKRMLQQWFGYCLTGETREQKLVFLHGPGGTGKSTLANTMLRIMATYSTVAAMETFTDSTFDRHPEELARLDGLRLVVASETEAGHKWRENRVKLLTGGDPITARYMRQDSFTYWPRFKLTFLGNHAPAVTNLDAAIQRRVIVVPFDHKPAAPDLHLENVLAQEWPGILRWMIDGAVDWYGHGLILPKAVSAATTRYFDEQNIFGEWLAECCEVDRTNTYLTERTADLFASWSAFAKSRGETPGTQATFNQTLRSQGFDPQQIKALGTKGCRGIRLKYATQHWRDK